MEKIRETKNKRNTKSLYYKIFRDYYYNIKLGEIKSGTVITEKALCEKYCISRITAVRVMHELKAEGLISRTQKTGSVVCNTFQDAAACKKTVAVILSFLTRNDTEIIKGMLKLAHEHKIYLAFFYTDMSPDNERTILEELLCRRIDAIIIEPCTRFANIAPLSGFCMKNIPVLFIDNHMEGFNLPCISSDHRAGMYYITESLIRSGHTKIAYYPMHAGFISSEAARFNGYCEALAKYNIPVDENYFLWTEIKPRKASDTRAIGITYLDQKNAEQCIQKCLSLKDQPTAICCINDLAAMQVYSAWKSAGTCNKFIITGFDDTAIAKELNFTSVKQDYYNIGLQSIKKLLSVFKKSEDNSDILVPAELIVRHTNS